VVVLRCHDRVRFGHPKDAQAANDLTGVGHFRFCRRCIGWHTWPPIPRAEENALMGRAFYEVTARLCRRFWELHIPDVGVARTRTLIGANRMVREFIALAHGLDPEDGFDVRITQGDPV
jgi:hypothetical protein